MSTIPDVAPINLNRARKDRERITKKAAADENAVRYGRTKADRLREARMSEIAARRLDGQKFDSE